MKLECSHMFECPFLNESGYTLSDLTDGVDSTCRLSKGDCEKKSCVLQKEGSVTVLWKDNDTT